jgi:flagellar basal body L-ring protein FlgH
MNLDIQVLCVCRQSKIFIKNSPYKLKIDGMVRDEDIGPSNIVSTNNVYESKLEIVK